MGNLFSIERALRHIDAETEVTSDPARIASADRLILPGVGAFGNGMEELRRRGIADAIGAFVATGRPIFGICLGMQLMLSEGHEFGLHRGLDLIRGTVVRFRDPDPGEFSYKIPQIGWNGITLPAKNGAANGCRSDWKGTILQDVQPGGYFYFVHSYVTVPESREHVLAETDYGRDRFCSVIVRDNVSGSQFHPERSGETGLKMLRTFMTL
jgi:glutamine amidotransferase